MAIGTSNAYTGPYTANGSTTAFPFTFTVLAIDQVSVILRDSNGVESTIAAADYTVTLAGAAPSTGTVTFDTAPASGNTVYILLDPAFTQDIEFADGAAWLAKPVNDGYDESALRDQVLKRDTARAVLAPIGEDGLSLPTAASRGGKFLAFDAAGNPIMSSGTGADAGVRTDLAGQYGASLIGRKRTGTGAVVRTLDAIIDDGIPVHPRDFGCACDGTTDDTANLQKMLDESTAWNIDCGGASFKISAGLTKTLAKDALFVFKNAHFISAGVPTNTPFLKIQGAVSGSARTINNAASGASSLTLTSGSVATGDNILVGASNLWSDTAVTNVPSVTMGEWANALFVAGSTITLAAPLRYDYSSSPTVNVYSLPKRVVVENVTGLSDNSAYSHSVVAIWYCADATARGVVGYKCANSGVEFNACVYAYSENCGNMDPPIGLGLAYGVVSAYAGRDHTHVRPRGRGCRHVVAAGGYTGVLSSITVIEAAGDNMQEGLVDAHAAVDEQFVLFGNSRISGSVNSKVISSQARRLTVIGMQAYNVANPIVWYPACTAYPARANFTGCDLQGQYTALYCANNSTQTIDYINIDGNFVGGLGGVSGDGVTISHSTNLAATSATPGRIKTVRFRGRAKGFQRGFYALTGTQVQKIDYIDLDGTFSVGDTATGHFPVSFAFNADADMTHVKIRGVTENGVYGVQLLHTQTADADIYATGYLTDVFNNYQAADGDALNRFDLRARTPSGGAKRGSVTVNGTTPVTVTAPAARATSRIWFQLATVGGTPGALRVTTITSGTSFAVTGTAGDTSTYWWWLENPVTGP